MWTSVPERDAIVIACTCLILGQTVQFQVLLCCVVGPYMGHGPGTWRSYSGCSPARASARQICNNFLVGRTRHLQQSSGMGMLYLLFNNSPQLFIQPKYVHMNFMQPRRLFTSTLACPRLWKCSSIPADHLRLKNRLQIIWWRWIWTNF